MCHLKRQLTIYLSEQHSCEVSPKPRQGQDFDERQRSFTGSHKTTDFTDEPSGEEQIIISLFAAVAAGT